MTNLEIVLNVFAVLVMSYTTFLWGQIASLRLDNEAKISKARSDYENALAGMRMVKESNNALAEGLTLVTRKSEETRMIVDTLRLTRKP